MAFLKFALASFLVVSCGAAPFYVDNTATNGLANGTSWSNAWLTPDTINWNSVGDGDTVYISGGATSQVYSSDWQHPLMVGRNNVTVSVGQDPGHNGLAIIAGSYVDASGRSNVRITGRVNGQPRLMLANFYDTVNRTFANEIYADGSVRLQVDFCVISNVNQCVSLVAASGFNVLSNLCYARGDAAIRAVNSPDNGWDSHWVRGNVIYLDFATNQPGFLGPDGVQGSHGLTICSNLFKVRLVGYQTSTQHPDYTQVIGNHTQIHSNFFWNIGDSGCDFDWWANPTPHDILVFNNVFYIDTPVDPYPEFIRWYASAQKSITSISNFQIVNNTMLGNTKWSVISGTWGASGNPTVTGCRIANNAFNDGAFNIASNPALTPTSMTLSNNIYAPGQIYTWLGTNYFGSSMPQVDLTGLVGAQSYMGGTNFCLVPGSLGIGKALRYASVFQTDKDSVPRNSWDIGAHEYVAMPPVAPTGFAVR